MSTPCALTIAGSDSGGGAGIQADLKAFARSGIHGTCAITAITAQNTLGVSAVHFVPADVILAQVRAVIADIRIDAVKVGMLGTAEIVHAVARALDELSTGIPVVVDPVMVAESGAHLLDPDAQGALVAEILPRATVLTPNLPEARALVRHASGEPSEPIARATVGGDEDEPAQESPRAGVGDGVDGGPDTDAETESLVRALLTLGPQVVVLTGGHRTWAVDLFADSTDPERVLSIPGARHPDGAAHGSGCTHSSVLAAQLALGRSPLEAARTARVLAGGAVANGLRDVGEGVGPVDVLGLKDLRAAASIVFPSDE